MNGEQNKKNHGETERKRVEEDRQREKFKTNARGCKLKYCHQQLFIMFLFSIYFFDPHE